jgi:hypothetical protein
MKKIVVILLRAPVVALALAVIVGAARNPSLQGIFEGIAALVFCYAIWTLMDPFIGPREQADPRGIRASRKVKTLLFIAIACLVIAQAFTNS